MATPSIALITGAARGIGYACAEALAEDGHRVVLTDVNRDGVMAAAQRLGGDAVGRVCDVADPGQVNALFDQVESELGVVSVLVNNAGISEPGEFLEITVEQFQRVIEVNLTGSFVALQRAAKTMVARQVQGSIVNMSSVNAVLAIPTIAPYCASKGGIKQLTKAAAVALAPHNIRVNAVGPGSIDTEMMASVNDSAEAMARVMSRTPLKRIGTPREIADVVAFLASDKASYITGETVYIDGGRMGMNYTC